ncbi:MAG: hypothetical protein COU25_01185 [Candidatus Levybacteria bacterium CG10_big_fil_rev_8_21_14_0_10_35_13]|nr:MAG: hypothetical protein COU25_01185 [Candidatus Levybacteria bacterium CG10_big_fil_rev_8_21_14_0_10_35_13]
MGLEAYDFNDDLRFVARKEEAAAKFVEESVSSFESSFDSFISGETDLVTLFKGDFKQHPEGFSFGPDDYTLEFLAGKDSFVTVRDGILRIRFLEIINDFSAVTSASTDLVSPKPITDGLKEFIGRHPRLKTKVTSLIYDFGEFEGDREQVVVNRYFHPVNNQPISEVWYAQRDYSGVSPDTDVRYIVVPRSHAAILKRTEGISGGI